MSEDYSLVGCDACRCASSSQSLKRTTILSKRQKQFATWKIVTSHMKYLTTSLWEPQNVRRYLSSRIISFSSMQSIRQKKFHNFLFYVTTEADTGEERFTCF